MDRIRPVIFVVLLGLVLLLVLLMPLSDWRSASAAPQAQDETACDPAKLEALKAKLKEARVALAKDRSSEAAQAAYEAALAEYEAYAAACTEAQQADLKAPGGPSLLATGGPDAFGYTYIDSDEAGGPTFAWADISAATALGLGNDDFSNQPIGFTFNFYGTPYTEVAVSSNGYLNFDNGTSDFAPDDFDNDCPIPNAFDPNTAIYGLWDDLDPSAGGEIYVYTSGTAPGRVFIVQYHNVPFWDDNDVTVRFQVILVESSNLILIQYDDVQDSDDPSLASGSSATEGLESPSSSPSGLSAVQYKSCNTAGNLHNGLAVLYKPPQIVNTTADHAPASCDPLNGTTDCTLREAIFVANALPGKDTIKFNIPATTDSGCNAGTEVCTIQPLSALPVITDTVTIDGYSQTGATPATATTNADLKIVLDGSQAGDGRDGLVLVTDGSTVKGLVIHGFRVADISNYGYVQGNGIVILGHAASGVGNNNVIAGNFIGTDATGTACVGNGGSGVLIGGFYSTGDTYNNVIGGTNPADRNVITCNGFQDQTVTGWDGVTIWSTSDCYADDNQVLGNYIGADVNGTAAPMIGADTYGFDHFGNTGNGVRITGYRNTVGGTSSGERNIISGNELAGVRIEGVEGDWGSVWYNEVLGNYIGTDVNGTSDLGNRDVGVYIVGIANDADSNQVGGTTGTTPGGPCTGACNLISGNGGGGVMILGGQASGNEVKGNYIGTDVNGDPPIPNDADGIAIADAEDNTIGGATPEERNLVSGNGGQGISIVNNAKAWSPGWELFLGAGEASGNTIQGNYIGAEVTGTAALSNTLSGILIVDAADNVVSENLISGNGANGVVIMTTGGAPGNVETNVVTVEGTANGNPVKGSDGATVTVGGTSWLEVTKTADPTHLAASGTVTFTIGITNTSGVTATIKRLSDSGHGNLNGQGACSVPQTLGPGLSYTCVFSATVSGAAGGSQTDTVTASGTDANGNFVINSDSATVNIGASPSIRVTKTASPTSLAPPGGTVNFTVTVENLIGSTVTITKTWDTKHGKLIPDGLCGPILQVTLNPDDTFQCTYSGTVSGATGNTVEGNFIGADFEGDEAIPNQVAGVVIATPDNAIEGNVISGNAREGVVLIGVSATGNSLWHNLIGAQADGASPLGNGSHGVFLVADPSDNAIGSSTGVSNTIAYNGGDGVLVFSGTGNQILSNSIFTNTELGIDLGDDNAVTSNDDTDPDTGANNLQNYPVLTTASTDGETTTITGTLNSITDTQFTIQFFSSPASLGCDPSGFGEGRTYLETDTTTTDGSGNATTSATVTGDLTGEFITATATDPSGNTSEFSNCIPVPAAPVLTINKQVQNMNGGAALPGDTLQYTINYSNTGNAPATGVFITDIYSTYCITRTNVTNGDFPDHDDSGASIRWPATGGILLDAQASGLVSYRCTLAGAGAFPDVTTQVTNTATIYSNETDPEEDKETVCVIRFDFNRNGEVDVGDVMAVATRWRLTAALPDPDDDPSTPNYEEKYDVDGDGVITVVDIMRVVAQWGQTCP